MPVNFWPILLPVIFLYVGGMWLLYRKSRRAAGIILVSTILCTAVVFLNLNVETGKRGT